MKSLVLGSNSPRRKELLTQLGFAFQVRVNTIDETPPEAMTPELVAGYLASKKNQAIERSADEIVLTADTVVIRNGMLLGKPSNDKEAAEMLAALSNGKHQVITGVCISAIHQVISFSSETIVTFNKLSPEDIRLYINKFKPADKAGAYGIQEWIGLAHIRSVEGSFYNVVGLPTDRVFEALNTVFKLKPFNQ